MKQVEVLTKEEAEREFKRSKEYEEVQLDLFIKTYKQIQNREKIKNEYR